MGRVAIVDSSERVEDDDGVSLLVKCDPGGDALVTAQHFDSAGVDAPPLPGDSVALEDSAGAGSEQVAGYADTRNAGKAEPGERRTYARDSSGEVVCEIWAKGNGDIDIQALKAGAKIRLGKVEIDQDGNLTTPGEITGMAATPATAVKLSTHIHPTGVGPSGPPQPGT